MPLEPRRADGERLLRPDDDAALLRLEPEHVERLGLAADLEAAALADGEVDQAAMARRAPGRRGRRSRRACAASGRTFSTTRA